MPSPYLPPVFLLRWIGNLLAALGNMVWSPAQLRDDQEPADPAPYWEQVLGGVMVLLFFAFTGWALNGFPRPGKG